MLVFRPQCVWAVGEGGLCKERQFQSFVCVQERTHWVGMCPQTRVHNTQTEENSNTLGSVLTYKHEDTQSQRLVYLVELSDICLKWKSCSCIINSFCLMHLCKHTAGVVLHKVTGTYMCLNQGWTYSICLVAAKVFPALPLFRPSLHLNLCLNTLCSEIS